MNNLKYTMKQMDTVLSALVFGAFATTAARVANSGEMAKARTKQRKKKGQSSTQSYCEPVPMLPISPPQTFSMNDYFAQGQLVKGQRVPTLNRLGEKEALANNPLPPRDYIF